MKTLLMMTSVMGAMLASSLPASACCGEEAGAMAACKAGAEEMACPTGGCEMQPAAPVAAPAPAATVKEGVVNTEALAAMLRAKVTAVLLDARSGKYDDGRRLPGAKSLAPTAKEEEVKALLPDKAALVVTYCSGLKCPASHLLGERLRGLGYTNVLEYHEGMEGWTAAGHAVEQAAK